MTGERLKREKDKLTDILMDAASSFAVLYQTEQTEATENEKEHHQNRSN